MKLQEIRERAELSQHQMGECLGMKQQEYSKLESGKHTHLRRTEKLKLAIECMCPDCLRKFMESRDD